MHYPRLATIGTLVVAVGAGACNRAASDNSRETTAHEQAPVSVDRAAELQKDRDHDISRLDERVGALEHKYTEANQKVVSGDRTATAGLREELKEDVTNVRQAVNDLRTTTPENWWERHEHSMKRTTDDIEADVKRLAGDVTPVPPARATGTTGETVSTAPFTSRRDELVADLRARVDAMERALDGVKASGARKTEVDDTRARVKKLRGDLDKLRSASADDWWDVTKARVTDYVDRVEGSVNRLDDNKK